MTYFYDFCHLFCGFVVVINMSYADYVQSEIIEMVFGYCSGSEATETAKCSGLPVLSTKTL